MSAPRPLGAVLFDLDGVIVATETWWHGARVAFAAAHGATWTDADSRACMGVSTREWAEIMRDRIDPGLSPDAIADAILGSLEARYRETAAPEIPGAPEQVRRIAAAVPVALASGSHRRLIDAALAATGLTATFGAIVAADEVAHGKPWPDVYLEAARRLGAAPDACLVVEDSLNGVRAGKAAGMRVVLVPNPHALPDAPTIAAADVMLPGLAALDPARPPA